MDTRTLERESKLRSLPPVQEQGSKDTEKLLKKRTPLSLLCCLFFLLSGRRRRSKTTLSIPIQLDLCIRGLRMKGKLAFFIWVLYLWGPCNGRYVVEKDSLLVTSPESMKGNYECAIGNFGIPEHGGAIVGTVIYPKANQKSCRRFDQFDISFKSRPGWQPTVVLVDRGDCYFALKVWNAQTAGAAAILVADYMIEPLIMMDTPEEENANAEYLQNITIPSALISKTLGDNIKKALWNGEVVTISLSWSESLPHPDKRVKYEFWMSSNNECGPECDSQIAFVKNFKDVAQIIESRGYTQFTPHYITWYCPKDFIYSKQCRSQCINRGRYCAPNPEQDFGRGFEGRDVVVQNLRQVCLFKVANESGRPWLWWDYVTDFATSCTMKHLRYNKQCADEITQSLGLDLKAIDKCIGNPGADEENPALEAELDVQNKKGSRGDVMILPTLVINHQIYRGELDKDVVLMAIAQVSKTLQIIAR